ncbi:MAG: hypothetical protein ACOCUL_04395 [Bacteroidota bacterium]
MKKEKENIVQENEIMTRDQFFRLADYHGLNCISIFLPTFRAGQEVDSHKGELRLKNLMKELNNKLEEKGLKIREIEQIMKPLQELLEDVHFWRNQSDGLAIFLNDGNMETYTTPIHFDEFIYVSDHYYLKPLVSLFSDNGKFYLLALSLKEVRFFEGSRHAITEIDVGDIVPGQLEDVVGYDYEDKTVQFRTGHGGSPAQKDAGAAFHGHGDGKDDEIYETVRFFRAVNEGIMKLLHDQKDPLVLACIEKYKSMYKKANTYKYLHSDFVDRNPDEDDPVFLHELAWEIVKEDFKKERKEKTAQFLDLSAGGKTSGDLKDIIPAAVDGRIDTLFIQPGKEEYGIYNHETHEVLIGDKHESDAGLFNMAVVHTLKNGGQVFKCDPEEMPLKDTEINALLRF